jgi:mono/diheme cytochrome c family protein
MMLRRSWSLLLGIPFALLTGGCGLFPRMTDQEAIKPYEQDMPALSANLVPVSGGDVIPTPEKARALANPVKASAEATDTGRVYYGYYCRHCHGATGDSRTPVGDSYVPMPTRLDSARVQAMTDGELYRAMLLGQGHEPVMKSTVSPERRWHIAHFIRTLKR